VSGVALASGGRIEADHLVNAAGAWAKEVCAMVGEAVPIEPLKRYEHYFETQDPIEPLPYIKDTFDALRVVDSSIMPRIVTANLNATTMMLAEKLSDRIRGRDPIAPWTAPVHQANEKAARRG
jgi:hypothetical protein